ncbi:MAG: LysM peptidoglycan-binding domain-containing protein [Candidatus Flexifilum sp.]
MRRTQRVRTLQSTSRLMQLILITLCVVLGLTSVVGAQPPANLLLNPGFEAPFTTVSGTPPMQVASNWQPWFLGPLPGMSLSENVQPEYYPASDTINGPGLPRARSGDAQQYLSFFATHTGGVYQVVRNVTPGVEYRFGIYAWLWSSSFDDPNRSEGDGGLILQVGIDPNGGTPTSSDPAALQAYLDGITWSPVAANQYDEFDYYTISATARSSTITVIVRSTVSFPVKYNVVYLDDAELTAAGSVQPPATVVPPTTTPVPPTATAVPSNTPVPPTATTAASNTPVPPTSAPATTTSVPPVTATQVPPTVVVIPTNTSTSAPPTSLPASPTPPPTITPLPPSPTAIVGTPTPYPTVNRTVYPATIEHVVMQGQSVFAIAGLYGSSVEAIIWLNNLPPNGLIFVGQRLLIPVGLVPPVTALPGTIVPPMPPTATLITLPTLVPPTVPPIAPPTAQPPPTQIYIVRPGDTLSGIAARFGVTVRSLIQANGILNPNLIFYGQRLIIPTGDTEPGLPPLPTAIVLPTLPGGVVPPPQPTVPTIQTYRVQPGDSLYTISLRFGVPVDRLIRFNGIQNPNRIFPGQIVVIPPG